jgi:hypothetical protein
MKALVIAATLAAGLFLTNSPPAFSADQADRAERADRLGLLTREQMRAYHACLFEAWIDNYCHATSWGYSHVYSQCIIANGGGIYPFEFRFLTKTEDYCWYSAQGLTPR